MKVFVVSVMLISAALAAPSLDNKQNENSGALSLMAKVFGSCADSEEVATCLAVKGITALNRAARSNNIEITNGVTFVRDPSVPAARQGKAISENEITSTLPSESEERTGRLIDMAMQSAADFIGSHNLQIKMPAETTQNVARAIEEGRGKMKKLLGPLLLAAGVKIVALIPIFLGGLFLLAAKAAIVAKIALVLAAVLGFSKLGGAGSNGLNVLGKFGGALGGGGSQGGWGANTAGWGSGNNGWSSGSTGSYPYARSIDAQDLAYSGQASAE